MIKKYICIRECRIKTNDDLIKIGDIIEDINGYNNNYNYMIFVFNKKYFIPLDEWREQQINKILENE